MSTFCVNKNGHEVHNLTEGCERLPQLTNQVYLGEYASCRGAVRAAKGMGYQSANGCFYCARECHTS